MIRRLRGPAIAAALLAIPVLLDAAFKSVPFELALRVWTVAVAGILAAALTGVAAAELDRERLLPLLGRRPRREPEEHPQSLADVERAIEFATWSRAEVDRRLRPLLRELAGHRLRVRHGIGVDDAGARSWLGDELHQLTRPAAPGDPAALRQPGLPLTRLRSAVQQLEQI